MNKRKYQSAVQESKLKRFLNKVYKFQYIMVWFLLISTTLMPDGKWSEWLYDFLPPTFYVSETFPLSSKVVNNYVVYSAIILSFIVCFEYYDDFMNYLEECNSDKSIFCLLKEFFSFLMFMLLLSWIYFGYLFGFDMTPDDEKFAIFFKNYILFGLISPNISHIWLLILTSIVFRCINLVNILFSVRR